MRSGDHWFAPKRCGYGAGAPLTWQGWILTLAYVALVTGAGLAVLPVSVVGFVALMAGATAAFLLIAARKTEGGWRWRGGCGRSEVAPKQSKRRRR